MDESEYKYHVPGSSTHMWRAVLIWERPDGGRVAIPTKQFMVKGAATQAAHRAREAKERNSMHMDERDVFVSYRIERSLLVWHVIEVGGESVA